MEAVIESDIGTSGNEKPITTDPIDKKTTFEIGEDRSIKFKKVEAHITQARETFEATTSGLMKDLTTFYQQSGCDPVETGNLLEKMTSDIRVRIVGEYQAGFSGATLDGRGNFLTSADQVGNRDLMAHELIHLLAYAKGEHMEIGKQINSTLEELGHETSQRDPSLVPSGNRGDVGRAFEEALAESIKSVVFPGVKKTVIEREQTLAFSDEKVKTRQLVYERECEVLEKMITDLSTLSGKTSEEIKQAFAVSCASGEFTQIPKYIEEILGGYEGYGLVYLATTFMDVGISKKPNKDGSYNYHLLE
jgi:hypothetical protein